MSPRGVGRKRRLTAARITGTFDTYSRHWWFARLGNTSLALRSSAGAFSQSQPTQSIPWRVTTSGPKSSASGALDQKHGRLFSKLAKEITVAAKMGGGDPGGNPAYGLPFLRRWSNPCRTKTLERAINRDSGEGPESTNFEELIYESYAPGGVAV